jgi:hypothetical protein
MVLMIAKARRFFLLLLSLALLGGGLYLLFPQLTCLLGLSPNCSVRGFGLMLAGSLTGIGGYLLWDEFIRRWVSGDD